MKLPHLTNIPQILATTAMEIWSAVKELRIKLVKGLPIISKAARPKPFEDTPIARRNIKAAPPSTPVATVKPNPPISLASARTKLMDQVRTGLSFTGEVNESLLNKAVDLALMDKGLTQWNGELLEATDNAITEELLPTLESQVYNSISEPEASIAKYLSKRSIPTSLVTAFLKASGEGHTQNPKLDIVLGDYLLAGINSISGDNMSRSDLDRLITNAESKRAMRTGTVEEQGQYLEQLIAQADTPEEKNLLNKFQGIQREHLKTSPRMLIEVKDLAREFACPAWQGTLNAIALTTDGIMER